MEFFEFSLLNAASKSLLCLPKIFGNCNDLTCAPAGKKGAWFRVGLVFLTLSRLDFEALIRTHCKRCLSFFCFFFLCKDLIFWFLGLLASLRLRKSRLSLYTDYGTGASDSNCWKKVTRKARKMPKIDCCHSDVCHQDESATDRILCDMDGKSESKMRHHLSVQSARFP